MKFYIKDFFSKWGGFGFPADLGAFTAEKLVGKLQFFCAVLHFLLPTIFFINCSHIVSYCHRIHEHTKRFGRLQYFRSCQATGIQ